eukprot:TRINITY_DN23146_c0_g1_i1.p1 TRINITY_DN23146_c0_g1~~TRINITY_DN23146_c0_g1_i1.p1  ORF type:complete len:721 (+),score=139.43 TRINITY_DN23146_c0_g1_i1:74-2164(+)
MGDTGAAARPSDPDTQIAAAGVSDRRAAAVAWRAARRAIVAASRAGRGALDALLEEWRRDGKELSFACVASALVSAPQGLASSALRYLAAEARQGRMLNPDGRANCLAVAMHGLPRSAPEGGAETRELLCALAEHAERLPDAVQAADMARMLYGMQAHNGGPQVERILRALAPRLGSCPESLGVKHLAMALYGMRGLASSPAERRVFAALAELAARSAPAERSDGVTVAMALYGLRLRQDSRAARRIIGALVTAIDVCDSLNASATCTSFQGLRLHHPSPAARAAIAALSRVAPTEPMSAKQLGAALHSLYLSGWTPELDAALRCLREHAELLPDRSPAEPICMGIYGLCGLTDDPNTRAVLVPLARVLRSAGTPPTPRGMGLALYGLRGQCGAAAAGEVILALASRAARGDFEPRSLGMALLGLSGSPPNRAARALLAALLPAAAQCAPVLPPQAFAMALTGIQGQAGTHEADAVFGVLVPRLWSLPAPLPEATAAAVLQGLVSLSADGLPCAAAVQEAIRKVPARGIRSKNPALAQALSLSGTAVPSDVVAVHEAAPAQLPPACSVEQRLRWVLETAGVPGVRFNSTHGPTGFVMDIRCGAAAVELLGLGMGYRSAAKQRLRLLRAALLAQYGIVERQVSAHGRSLAAVVEEVAAHCSLSAAHTEPWVRARELARKGWGNAKRRAVEREEAAAP